MTEGNFVDYVKVNLTSGNGGKGSVHLHREKFITKGGPDGGDGGRGGHVIIRGNKDLWTLLSFKFSRSFRAGHGEHGAKSRSTGADGEDVYLDVPLGTVIKDAETEEVIMEITDEGEEKIILPGGLGGRGNWHFRTATNQTPRYAQPGIPGQELAIIMELKLLADVGLVGFPNAGKSTLLSVLTTAKPKIADYEFTTLKPNLGIVKYREFQSFVMADIPGIIEEAHQGKGLGIQFLRHIERNNVLLFMVSADTDVEYEYNALVKELKVYRKDLLDKPRVLAITKMDLKQGFKLDKEFHFDDEIPVIPISSATGFGVEELREVLWEKIQHAKEIDT